MPIASDSTDSISLLSGGYSFQKLLWPYFTPYLLYVSLSLIPETILSIDMVQIFKLLVTGSALLWFRNQYHFGPFKPAHAIIALAALPVALLFWIAPFYLLTSLGLTDIMASTVATPFSARYFSLRLVNSVILVAIFEEVFIRIYVMGWLHQAGSQIREKGLLGSLLDTLDQNPVQITGLPLLPFSVIGATLLFSTSHLPHEYLSSVCYFLFTTWVYKLSGSLWVCIIIHGLTNLSIALLVRYAGMMWLW